jgi:inosine-uridine nucleoside N-ribohydrolase
MATARRFWIDTDTASDDAVAMVMAFKNPTVEVVGISVVAGNVQSMPIRMPYLRTENIFRRASACAR